jgi:hypothetical protein
MACMRGGVQRSGFFGKALQLRFGNPLNGLTRTVQGLQPPRMGDMLANAFRRRAFGFAFETLPRTGGLLGLARQEASDRRPLHVVERGGHLLVIAHVDLGTRFLRGPTECTERREFIARLHQGFDPHVDQIGENVLALGGLQHRPHEDATPPPRATP